MDRRTAQLLISEAWFALNPFAGPLRSENLPLCFLTAQEVSAGLRFLRVSEGTAPISFFGFKGAVYFLYFKKNQNVPEF